MIPEIIGQENLDEFIWQNKSNKMIVLYFSAPWCGPCQVLKQKIIDNIITMSELVVCYIDIDNPENDELCEMYKVTLLPTQIFIKLNNIKIKVIDRIDGYDWTKFLLIYDQNKNIEN
jgi:thiol-disulfide isomerase/thioredoxin